MASSTAKINITELDFDAIKNNLKNYLRSQSEFQDYDFEGSAINILLDILAYNTHYNAYYMNMIANEMFMDSSTLRSSTVSHAKLLGYTPRSATSSLAVVNLTVTRGAGDTTSTLTIPRFTPFMSEALNGASFRFLNMTEQTVQVSANKFNFTELELKEGQETSYVFTVSDATNPNQIFVLPDLNVDTSTIEVLVQKSSTSVDREKFTLAEDATEVTSSSAAFFLEENVYGKYQIYFGDGIIGRKLDDGNLVIVSYIVTNGANANGLKKFTLQTPLLAGSTSNTTTLVSSSGASDQESIDSIKFSAPKSFVAQNRAVTKNDYIALINKKYPYFDAVTVWGGEEELPPIYGKVFISAKPKFGFEVTQTEKEYVINNIIKPISVLTVSPEFVDVDYNYLNFAVKVVYNPVRTNKTANEVKTAIRNAVATYANENFNSFNSTFQVSRLLRAIDDSEVSILSSSLEVYLEKKISPDLTKSQTYTLDYGTELHRGISTDRLYSSPYFIQADGTGTLRECYLEETPFSFTGIEEIKILTPGRNFTSTPEVVITGDGYGATARAVVVNGKIQSIVIVSPGTQYTTASAIVVGGGGTGVSLLPIMQGRTGVLRSYYFDSSKNKIILNDTAGTIDYVNGKIVLSSFAPTEVGNDLAELSVYIRPATTEFNSNKNKLMTYDDSNESALSITLIPSGS